MERPEVRVRWYWLLANAWASALVMFTTAFVVLPIAWDGEGVLAYTFVGGWLLLGALLGLYSLIAPWVRHRAFRFLVTDRQLWARDGVIFQREKVIPSARLQHVDVSSGPIERLFGLASLVVFTAGGSAATFRVPGLTPQRAELLRARVLEVAERGRSRVEPTPAPPEASPSAGDGI